MSEIQKRPLGKTGLDVSVLGYGSWPIGGNSYAKIADTEAMGCVNAYLDAGGNFIDSAIGYGEAEDILGRVFQQNGRRHEIVLASKTFKSQSLDTIPQIRDDLEATLKALQTDYLDIYYMHAPPDEPEIMEAVLDEYEKLKQEGKIRCIGASIKGPSVTPATPALARQYIDSGRIDVLQMVYSIFRQMNLDVFEYALEKGVGIVARTALESGFLGGKYRPGHQFTTGHRSLYPPERQEILLKSMEQIEKKAVKAPFETIAQVAVKFSTAPETVSTLIVGARTAEQINQLRHTMSLPELDQDLMAWLIAEFGDKTESLNPSVNKPGVMKFKKP